MIAFLAFVAIAASTSPRDRMLEMLRSEPVYREDVDMPAEKARQLELFADAEDRATLRVRWPGGRLELAAMLDVVLTFESHASLRIQAGECRPRECDRGRARGPFQQHVTSLVPQDVWERLAGVDAESTDLATLTAARAIARARASCRELEGSRDWVAMTFAHYAGRGCLGSFRGLDARVRDFRRLFGRTGS